MRMIRQGDVLVKQMRKREPSGKDARAGGRVILAYGEVTGHHHEVIADVSAPALPGRQPAQFFEEPDGRRFLFVEQPCLLTHQEHGPITIAPGCYEVIRQREYSPEEIRNVAD